MTRTEDSYTRRFVSAMLSYRRRARTMAHEFATNLSMSMRWKDKGDIYEVVDEANTNNRRW